MTTLRFGMMTMLITLITACGTQNQTNSVLTPSPIVITQIVTQVTTVIITTTPIPDTSTPLSTKTPTLTPEPTIPPTVTPDPIVHAKTTRETGLYSSPDEGYSVVTKVAIGSDVAVLHKGGQWFEVRINNETGWVYRDWIDLSKDKYEQIPVYPKALPVFVGRIVQEYLSGTTFFKGQLYNVGSVSAYNVRVEIETFDAAQDRVDIVKAYVEGGTIPPNQERSFEGYTTSDYTTFKPAVLWDTSQ